MGMAEDRIANSGQLSSWVGPAFRPNLLNGKSSDQLVTLNKLRFRARGLNAHDQSRCQEWNGSLLYREEQGLGSLD